MFDPNKEKTFDIIKLKLFKWLNYYVVYPLTDSEIQALKIYFGGRKRYGLWETSSRRVLNRFDKWTRDNDLHFAPLTVPPHISHNQEYSDALAMLSACIMQPSKRLASPEEGKGMFKDLSLLVKVFGGFIDVRPATGARWYCKDNFVKDLWLNSH